MLQSHPFLWLLLGLLTLPTIGCSTAGMIYGSSSGASSAQDGALSDDASARGQAAHNADGSAAEGNLGHLTTGAADASIQPAEMSDMSKPERDAAMPPQAADAGEPMQSDTMDAGTQAPQDAASPSMDATSPREQSDAAHDQPSSMQDASSVNMDAEVAADATLDAGSAATNDASTDASTDAQVDASADAQVDASTDAALDAATDAQVDAGAATDAQVDASTDAALDAATDAQVDAAPPTRDASPDGRLCASCGGCEEIQPIKPSDHTDSPVTYPDPPPTSGPHNPCWARYGVYDTPVKAERWVHNLEHGGVVLLYNCPAGCPAELDQLKQFQSTHKQTTLTGYSMLPVRFAIVSWGHRLVTDCVDVTAFSAFYSANYNHASESNSSQPDPACPP